ncbi:MAG TPA: glycosyltransferase [Mycobacteriales bacterium]|nr:glycosyltransferase [Mycobacteriales bacterium]
MRIAMVSEHANPLATLGGSDAGGQNVYVAALSRVLGRLGHDVVVYTRRDSRHAPEQVDLAPGVLLHHVPAGPARHVPRDDLLPFMPDFGRWLARRWRAGQPDVVHSHFWMSGVAALLGVRDTGVPLVHTFHALGVVKRRHQGGRDTSPPGRIRIERAVAHDVDRIIALSSDEAAELARMGIPRTRLRVIPAGVDTDRFQPDGPARGRGGLRRMLTAGRLVERKGYDAAIAALRRIPGTELVIAAGPAADRLDGDPEYRRLRKIADRQGVADRVRFLGSVEHDGMPELIRSADVVTCAPWYEPFGIVPLEAMACGVPVVASAVGGFLDTVVDGATGRHVQPRRPDRLASAVRELLDDPFRRDGYGVAGLDRVRSRYTWDRIAGDVLGVYRDVAGRPGMDAGGVAP